MKKYVRQIAMGLVLILFVGLLAGCGEIDEPHDSQNSDIATWEWYGGIYAILKIEEVTDVLKKHERSSAFDAQRVMCELIYCNDGPLPGTDENNKVQVWFPKSWIENAEEGSVVLAQMRAYEPKEAWVLVRGVRPDEYNITQFEDGKLTLKEEWLQDLNEDRIYPFYAVYELLEIMEGNDERAAYLKKQIKNPLQVGMTIAEVTEFFERYTEFMKNPPSMFRSENDFC